MTLLTPSHLFPLWLRCASSFATDTGWEQYFTEILRCSKAGEELPYWGSIKKFNVVSVKGRKGANWGEFYDEFFAGSEAFIHQYSDLPLDLSNETFWDGKRYSLLKILEVNIHHYEKSHLYEIRKQLSRAVKQ